VVVVSNLTEAYTGGAAWADSHGNIKVLPQIMRPWFLQLAVVPAVVLQELGHQWPLLFSMVRPKLIWAMEP
jgi:hypothetical protein